MADATVSISVADVQPVARFIADVARAEACFRGMTADECAGMPDKAARGLMALQQALDRLGLPMLRTGGGGGGSGRWAVEEEGGGG